MSDVIYCYPKLSGYDFAFFRLGGRGLGNLLFPWARSVVAAEDEGRIPLYPTWPQLKVGPFLRGERDNRAYSDLFNKTNQYASFREKVSSLLFWTKIPENESKILKDHEASKWKKYVIVFEGMTDYFKSIKKRHKLVKKNLLKITKNKHKKRNRDELSKSICVHVRLGDFKEPDSKSDLLSGTDIYKLPMTWYKEKIENIRDEMGKCVKVNVFSGSDNRELRPILEVENTERKFYGSSIADLLALSNAGVLVTSSSTFSMWASYFGRMPAIWYPTQLPHEIYYKNPHCEVQSGEGEKLPREFVDALRSRPLIT